MNDVSRLRWFAMLSDSVFAECPTSESSLEMRRYMAAFSFPADVPVLSAFIMMCSPFRLQGLHEVLELILPPEADGDPLIRMDLNA